MGWRFLGFAHQICFMRRRLSARCLVFCCLAAGMLLAAAPARASYRPEIDASFRLLYELKFSEARAQFAAWETLQGKIRMSARPARGTPQTDGSPPRRRLPAGRPEA